MHEIDVKLTPVNIYIDLSKTFDTLNFDILLYKLHYYGITDIALILLKSYTDPGMSLNCAPTRVCRKSASRPGYVVKVRPDPGMS